jgi:hypothetical protein
MDDISFFYEERKQTHGQVKYWKKWEEKQQKQKNQKKKNGNKMRGISWLPSGWALSGEFLFFF